MTRRFCPVLAVMLLAGCTSSTDNFPSLARRDAERITGSAAVVPALNPVLTESLPAGQLEAKVAGARSAHARFLSRQDRATQLIVAARGAAQGGDAWSSASVALAELESARSEAMVALADLDELYAAARVAGRDVATISAARDQVLALVEEEDRVLAALR